MSNRPSNEELENRIRVLEKELSREKLTVETLKESEKRYRLIIDALNEGVILQEASGRIVIWNKSAEKLFGLTIPECAGPISMDTDRPAIHLDGSKFSGEHHPGKVTLRTGQPCQDVPMEILTSNGETQWISINTTPVLAPDGGKPQAVVISFSDITERRKVEQDLLKEAVRRRILIEQSRDGIVVISQNGKVHEANQKFADMLGYAVEQVKELYVWDWDAQWERKELLEMIRNVGETGDHFETRHRRQDNSLYDVEISTNGAVFEGKKMIFCVCRDITDRKKTEEALKESEDRFRRLFEEAPVAIHGYCPNGTIHYWNKANERTYGYTKEEAIGKNLMDLIIPKEMRTAVAEMIRHGAKTGEMPPTGEFFLRRKDGSGVPVLSAHVAIMRNSKETELYCLDSDLTELKRLQTELQQSHKMEAIGTLTGGIAHDFNNILGIVIGNSELALEDVPDWNPAHYNLKAILKAGLRGKDIVQQLLTFCRKTEHTPKAMHLIPAFEDVVRFIRATIPATIDIRHEVLATEDKVLCQPTAIYQVLMNLCSNSFQAMEKTGGAILMRMRNVVFNAGNHDDIPIGLTNGKFLKLTVADTGPGIDAAIVNRIFDPYYTTKEVGKGTGMGLAVVKGIVESHKGAVTVSTKPGSGATFTVYLPLTDEIPSSETEKPKLLKLGDETILFVDNEKSIADMGSEMLTRLGYTVEKALSPLAALDLFQSDPRRFDLVITDMTMPQMTGLQLTKRIKAINPNVSVILCTGFSTYITPEKADAMGIQGYLMKPIVKLEMANLVRKVLDESQSCG
jgi:two-component system cell cycle sensor histidine kinase/response regulator CckA